MFLSTHYYVLSFGTDASALFEAFRDDLIEVENQGFPVARAADAADATARLSHARDVDACFAAYHDDEPLGVVVLGESEWLAAFDAVTRYRSSILARVTGDHRSTRVRDLGRIVWPLVREAMSGVVERALEELGAAAREGRCVAGLEPIARAHDRWAGATLLVEHDFHRRGSIVGPSRDPLISPEVDVRDVFDDAVDLVIEGVLAVGGRVVFMPHETLVAHDHLVLLPRDGST